ncbi:MAG: metallophosphoesterase [Thermodesulfovibrionales bacterium]|nr:metallophosphoesterase [Thermodesulfovibrionales bacterium]
MKIGIISDTHDNLVNLKKALDIFNQQNVNHIIHAGDFTSPFTAKILMEFKGGFSGIFGNNDGDKLLLSKAFNGNIFSQPYVFNLSQKKIVVLHEPTVVDALAESGHYDLVIYGHTHKALIKQVKNTLVINPGEAGSWLYGKATVAIANIEKMTAEIVNIV